MGFSTELKAVPFDEDGPYRRYLTYQETQFGNLSYWLGNYDFRRMTRAEWQKSCDGPLIGFAPVFDTDNVVAVDSVRQMAVIEHHFPNLVTDLETRFGLSIADREGDRRMRSGCFGRDAEELSSMTGVGKFEDGYLVTSDRSGLLFLTPGAILHKGKYVLELYGSFGATQDAHILVFADDGSTILVDRDLPLLPQTNRIRIPMELPSWVSDLRIECQVTSTNQFAVRGIRIVSE